MRFLTSRPRRDPVYIPYGRPIPSWDGVLRSESELVEELEDLFLASVKRRLRSDVPVGIFLSGGLDSSLVAALPPACQTDVRTFTVKFPGSVVDETSYAARVGEYLGTQYETIDGFDIKLGDSNSQLFQSFTSQF